MANAYRFVTRSSNVKHGHPILVYNCVGQLDYELTRFAIEGTVHVNLKTIQVYLYAILPFFTWLKTDTRVLSTGWDWHEPPEQVRNMIEDYLVQHLCCQLQKHRQGFQLIRPTTVTPTKVRTFLVGLKFFYKVMKRVGYYTYPGQTH